MRALKDSNLRHAVLETAVLPTELRTQLFGFHVLGLAAAVFAELA